MAATPAGNHSANDVWRVVTDQGKAIGSLQSGLAEMRVRVDGGFASLSNQIAGVISSVEKLGEQAMHERHLRQPDTRGWIVAILGMLAIIGSIGMVYGQLVIHPVKEELRVQETRQWQLGQEASYVRGYMEALEKMGHYPKANGDQND